MDEAIKQRDVEWGEELEKIYEMCRNELKKRDEEYWKGQTKKDGDLARILERREKALQESFLSKDKFWSDHMDSYNHLLKSLYYEQINMRKSIKSIALRHGDLIKSNVDMLSWAIGTASGKKKVSMLKITISDFVPHVIVPPNGQSFVRPLKT